jgi:uncharacterized protein with GYD domain
MLFITVNKFRHRPTKQELDKLTAYYADMAKKGVKMKQIFWTLGRYDSVAIIESPDEKAMMKTLINLPTELATETLVAVPRKEAIKLLK